MASASVWKEGGEYDSLKKELLDLQIHRCTGCKNTLQKPIMTDPENGCNYCYCCKTGENLVRNEVLEGILHKLSIPCMYESNGCTTTLNYSTLKSHQEVCIKRKFNCPLKWSTNCKWEGLMNAILDHCNVNHKENVIRVSRFLLMDVQKGLKEVIVIKESKVFVVRLEHIEKTACEVYFVGDERNSRNFSFIINDCDSDPNHIYPLDSFCQNVTDTMTFIENPNRNRINIQIFCSDAGLDENLLTFFECPICKHVMRPPIFQCLTGHSVCQSCKPKLSSCSICRNNFGNARNYSLEAMCSKIRIPCSNQHKGCAIVSSGSTIDQHEDECNLRSYTCPLQNPNCSWEDQLINLSTHLRSKHHEKTFFSVHQYSSTYDIYRSTNTFEQSSVLAFGQVFRLHYQKDSGNCDPKWSLQFIGPKKDAKKFEYRIELIDESDRSKTAAKSSTCHAMSNVSGVTTTIGGDYLSITNNVISWFVRNGKIVYQCNIRKL